MTLPRTTLADVAVFLPVLTVALLPLAPVYGWAALVAPVGGGLAAGTALAALGAWRRWSAAVTSAAGVAVYLALGGAVAVPATTLGGVLPTGRTLGVLLPAAITVWKQALTLEPRLGGGAVLVAPFLLALTGSVAALSIAWRVERRAAAWAVAVPVAVLALALLLGTKESVAGPGVGAALALVTWAAWCRGTMVWRRVPAAVAVAALALTSGAVVGPWLGAQQPRFVLRDQVVPPFDPDDQASPLASFRRFVKEWPDAPVVTARGLPEGTPLRLAVMDTYDGVVWDVSGDGAAASGAFRRVGATVTAAERGVPVEVDLEVHHLPFVWLPTVGYAEAFTMHGSDTLDAVELAADLRYNDATGTAVLVDGVPDGTSWTTRVLLPEPESVADLGTAPVADVRLPALSGVPEAVRLLASEVAGTATSPALIAQALANGLHGRGWFSHGLTEQGEHPSLSGHGADRLTTLLTADPMVGDDEQYAAAMALMAREMGLPARVVLGFVTEEGGPEVTFTGADIAAWVEIGFAGHGWVPFHPTPERVLTADEDRPQDDAEPQAQVIQPPPAPPEPVQVQDEDTEQAGLSNDGQLTPEPEGDRTALLVGGGATLLVLLPLVLVPAAKGRRRRRRATRGDGVTRVVGGWDEVLDHARDLRRPAPARATRREMATSLAGAFGDDLGTHPGVGRAVTRLADRADAAVFGAGNLPADRVAAYWAEVDATLAAMRAAVPRRHRLSARLTTRSLRRPFDRGRGR